MPVYQCDNCSKAPCILITMDPEFVPNDWCTRKPEEDCNTEVAEWRELKVVE